jgi:hypothetical protein
MTEPKAKARHYLYFPNEAAAKAAVKEIAPNGWEVEHRLGADEKNWLVSVRHEWPITPAEFDEIERTLKSVATNHSGEYDGWEIPQS